MTTVPLPDVPCVKVSLGYQDLASNKSGGRFYLSYSGSAPSGADCNTLAADIAADWATDIAPIIDGNFALEEVDVIDIATHTGASGTWNGFHAGTNSGTAVLIQGATNVEFDIARRYRGGKPRMFFPPGVTSDLADNANWNSTFIGLVNTNVASFFSLVVAHSVGSMGTLKHVNLSYFQGFSNHTNTSGRSRAVPTYRATALHDNVTGYACKGRVGSQRRRRSATTH